MPNLQKTLLDKIFRPNKFKKIFKVRSQINIMEKMFDEAYMVIGFMDQECIMRYEEARLLNKIKDEEEIYKSMGEIELLYQLIQYRDILLEISKDSNFDVNDILNEVRVEKIKNLI